jgi:hypothetical protein
MSPFFEKVENSESTIQKQTRKIALFVAAALMLSGLSTVPSEAQGTCRNAHFRAVRAALVAQNTSNIRRVYQTRDCSLIPGVLAFVRHANAVVNQTLANTNGECSPQTASLSTAALEAQLRKACNSKGTAEAQKVIQTSKSKDMVANSKPVTALDSASPSALPTKQSGSCSDITGTGTGGSMPCPQQQGGPATSRTTTTSGATISSINNQIPSSNGASAAESLRALVPELGKLIDEADREVNSPNIPPPSQWQSPDSTPPREASRTSSPSSDDAPAFSSSPGETPSASNENSTPSQGQATDDDDYAEICRSEAVKNGLKSLKQDLAEAQKNEDGRFGLRFFVKKLKLQWATLKKCARDPMQRAVIEKLDQDPIILDTQ